MATVRLTRWIKGEISYELRRQFDQKIAVLSRKIEAYDVIEELVTHHIPADQREAAELLGEKWLNKFNHLIACIQVGDETHSWYSRGQPLYIPREVSNGDPPLELLPGMKHYDEVKALAEEMFALCDERDVTIKRVMAMLDSVTTVNKVVELWPSVVDYLGTSIKTRLKAPVEKRERAKPKPFVMDEETQASLVTLKLTK